MSELKELNDEELEKITGGDAESCPTRNVIVEYQDTVGGQNLWEDLGRFLIEEAQASGEAKAKEWCTLNNKIYTGWHLANLWTNNYNCQKLLTSLPTMSVSIDE